MQMSTLKCAEEIAYNEVKQRILDGRLAPGTRLVHRVLAKELGFSSGPVVLALRTLERDGLVTNTPGLGAHVTTWSRDEIIDLYHIRATNEGLAARLCAERCTTQDLMALEIADRAIRESVDAGNVQANIQAEVDFHMAVVRGGRCSHLERIISNLSITRASMAVFANNPRLPSSGGGHEIIIDAIRRRDSDAAEKAAREHVQDSLERNIAWIEQVDSGSETGHQPRLLWWAKKAAPVGL
jgi:DNA-binding GntR family transcriptional regulator